MRIILSIAAVLVSVGRVSGMRPNKPNSAEKTNTPPTSGETNHIRGTSKTGRRYQEMKQRIVAQVRSASGSAPGAGRPDEAGPTGPETHSHMIPPNENLKTHMIPPNENLKTHMVNNLNTNEEASSDHSETAAKTRHIH